MATVSEIAPDLFRISTFVPDFDLQFNQFLVRDDEPLLFHTGPLALFMDTRDAVATLVAQACIGDERRRAAEHRKVSLPVSPYAACAALLGSRVVVRRDSAHALVFGPL